MSVLENSINTIINSFHEYSKQLGHPDTLNRREFKQLVKRDLANFLKKEKRDERVINDIMEDLDTNEDNQLSFEEFIVLIGRLTEASHEEMHKNAPPGGGHSHGPGLGGSDSRPCGGQSSGGHGHGHSH